MDYGRQWNTYHALELHVLNCLLSVQIYSSYSAQYMFYLQYEKTISLLKLLHWERERERERERVLLCFGVEEGSFAREGIWYWLAGTTEYSFDEPSTSCAAEPIGIPITGFGIEFFILKKWSKKRRKEKKRVTSSVCLLQQLVQNVHHCLRWSKR